MFCSVFLIAILIIVSSLVIGLWMFLKPALAIEMQRRFYEKINWRITPISMQKELRNTRIMGLFLVCFALMTTVYIIVKP